MLRRHGEYHNKLYALICRNEVVSGRILSTAPAFAVVGRKNRDTAVQREARRSGGCITLLITTDHLMWGRRAQDPRQQTSEADEA